MPTGSVDVRLAGWRPATFPGAPAELTDVARAHGIGRVIVATPVGHDDWLVPVLRAARALGGQAR
ncbi:MAG TPA: hypothetical protein VIX86_07335 [Streptosporangiaceae bacterium]